MIKKVLSAVMAIVLLFGSAATLPEGVFETSSTITASAEVSGNYEYDVLEDDTVGLLNYNGDETEITIPSELDGKKVSVIFESVFKNCTSLKSVTIPDTVNYIGGNAFADCSSLESVYIPNSVTIIGAGAFKNCSSLKRFTIPESVTKIGDTAFQGCSSLESVNLPTGITRIGIGAFKGCSSLTSVDIPDSVTTIEGATFDGCSNLSSVTIPDSVKAINYSAFKDCTSLEDITIPDSVTSIGNSAFKGCINLTRVTIPSGVTSIGNEAFANCKYLESITIPDSVTSIGTNALYNCPRIKSVIVPKSVTSIGEKALGYYDDNGTEKKVNWFMICCEKSSAADTYAWDNGFERGFIEGDYIYQYGYSDSMIVDYIGSEANITIPSQLGGKTVTGIRSGSFGSCKSIVSLTIPDTVIVIGDSAFSSCTNLKSITLPNQLDSISRWLFEGCTSLEKITIPSSAKGICRGAFSGCTSLTSVTIPSGVKYLDPEAFKDCTSLKSVTIPGSVTNIDYNVFKNCTSLTSVTFKNGVTAIGNYMFDGCSKLSSVSIPDSVTTIEPYAFFDCTSLKKVTVPKTVETIGTKALGYYYDERGAVIPNVDFIVRCYKDSAADEYAKNNYVKIEYIDVKHVAAKDPTCTAAGNIEYWTWNKKYFSDALCTKEITKAQTVRKATGHSYGKPTWTWTGTKAATAKFVCANDKSHVETVAAKITSKTTKATCTADGKTVYTATVTFGGKTYTDTKTVTITKTGHKWGTPTWTWDGVKSATAKFVCENNSKHVKTVAAKITSKTTAATCEKDGKTVYTATVTFNGKTYTDTKTVTIKKLGHKWGEPTWTWDGTKTASAKFVCARDKSHVKTVTAKITSKTTAATCEKDGKTVYTATVTFGGKTYTDTKTVTITKTGHKYGTPTWTWSKDNKTCTAKFTCANDKLHVKTVAAKITSKTTKATCEKDGKTVYTATVTFNGKTYTTTKTVTIKKTGHKFSAWKTTGFDFAKKTSTQTRKCSVCGKTEKQTTTNAVSRFAGANRYDTAALISQGEYKNGTGTVVIATGLDFHDALVAVPLANAYNAPLLLTTDKQVTKQTEAELARLKAKKVIIVSTNGAVGAVVKTALAKYNPTMISGDTCYETATKVAEAMQKKAGKAPDTIFFATSGSFADALSVSPVAAIKNAPIIYLVNNTANIDPATAAYLKSVKGKVKNAYVIGGDGVISDAMMKNVATALGLKVGSTVQRVAGANRYETCVAVNKKFKSVVSSDGICVAKGLDFPDALAGGVYAAKTRQALFLADGKKLQDVQSSYLKGKNASKITVFGGMGAVPDDLVKLIAQASV